MTELGDFEPWSWIPHVEGADRQQEINAHLSRMLDEMPTAWKSAALRLGEQLADTGPNDYYKMTPTQWLNWCEKALTLAKPFDPEVVRLAVERLAGGAKYSAWSKQTTDKICAEIVRYFGPRG